MNAVCHILSEQLFLQPVSQSVPSFILILVTMMFLVVLCVVFIQCQVNIYSFVESYYISSML